MAAHLPAVAATGGDDTYVIDSRGTTVYRNGVAEKPPAATSPGRQAMPDRPSFATAPAVDAPFALSMPVAALPDGPTAPFGPRGVPATASGPQAAAEPGLTKEQKAVILNAGVAAAVTVYGVGFWDYFQTAPKASSEGWFGRTTSHGGMDKLGHFWTTYSVSHLYSYVYRWWDFDRDTANTLGAASGLGIQTAVELGDSFSGDFGFSYEDAIMNAVGAGAAYILGRNPNLARKIDFRLEYKPERLSDLTNDILTDYENQRYLIALKLDGFDMFHDSYLGYLELHAGYQARGYEGRISGATDNSRHHSYYLGVGFNVSKLIRNYANIGVFDYLQMPYASVGATGGLD